MEQIPIPTDIDTFHQQIQEVLVDEGLITERDSQCGKYYSKERGYFRYCLGSLEIRKIGISFIIGYHTLNQLKEMPYVQTSTSQIFRRSKNESSLGSRPGWSPGIPGM